MVRALSEGDTAAALELLRARPLHNVFLEHLVRSGLLGRVPGFFGHEHHGQLVAVLMVGPQGGTALEVRDPVAYRPLAEWARDLEPGPRHIVGSEDVTAPFFDEYERFADPLVWSRREPVYLIDGERFQSHLDARAPARIRPATVEELDQIVANSALQHVEDLGDDRFAADPEGFRRRHLADIREGRWWVLREKRRIAFQGHVGPENDQTVQIGGVLTPPDLRKRGWATRGVRALVARLLERHASVILFCAEDNAPARLVYERVGFAEAFHYRSYLLAEPAPCPGEYA